MMRGVALLLLSVGCAVSRAPAKDGPGALSGPLEAEFSVPDFAKRNYILHLPPGYRAGHKVPVVFALHGGGGKARGALALTCKDGNMNDAGCLTALADREGFAVVAPNGTGNVVLEDVRTWNAGGGANGWQCVSGDGCKADVLELAYFDAVFNELQRAIDVDTHRVFATGISNGGAMSHRLACERSMRFAAVASVAGGNQVAMVQGCSPGRAVPVMEIHGDEDPCWTFETSKTACAQKDDLKKVGVQQTIDTWVQTNGCASEPDDEDIKDAVDDGTRSVRRTFGACEDGAEVVLVLVKGGGHTWPGGAQYVSDSRVGKTARDFSANEEIWRFFKAHPLP